MTEILFEINSNPAYYNIGLSWNYINFSDIFQDSLETGHKINTNKFLKYKTPDIICFKIYDMWFRKNYYLSNDLNLNH